MLEEAEKLDGKEEIHESPANSNCTFILTTNNSFTIIQNSTVVFSTVFFSRNLRMLTFLIKLCKEVFANLKIFPGFSVDFKKST